LTEAMLTIAPEPASTIAFSAARVARRAMKKFICIAHSNSSSLVPKNPSTRIFTAPTLLTSTSTRPNSSTARATRPVGRRQVDGDRGHPLDPLEAGGRPRAGDDRRPLSGQLPGHGHADALAGTGDDRDLALEAEVH
jgi:hypothetical protein